MEKTIIQSKRSYVKQLRVIVLILLLVALIGAILHYFVAPELSEAADKFKREHGELCFRDYGDGVYYSLSDEDSDEYYAKRRLASNLRYELGYFPMLIGGGLFVISGVFLWAISKMEINVTDKRVYGKAIFGKRIDLPLDSISAVGTGALKGIVVATSSGKIHFLAISNNTEIHEEITKLLVERQSKKDMQTTQKVVPQSNADELKKFKELLDVGVITQEEFDAKKKQLLGI